MLQQEGPIQCLSQGATDLSRVGRGTESLPALNTTPHRRGENSFQPPSLVSLVGSDPLTICMVTELYSSQTSQKVILHSLNLLVPSSCLVSERTGNPEGATGPRRTRLSTLEAAILFAFLWKLCGLIAGFSSLRAELEKKGGTASV